MTSWLGHHLTVTLYNCDITWLQHHMTATSHDYDITWLQHHMTKTSHDCNIMHNCNITQLWHHNCDIMSNNIETVTSWLWHCTTVTLHHCDITTATSRQRHRSTATSHDCDITCPRHCNTQGSYTTRAKKFQDFSRTFEDLFLNFPGLKITNRQQIFIATTCSELRLSLWLKENKLA